MISVSELPEEVQHYVRLVNDFVEKKCPPERERYFDETVEFPHELFSDLAELGLTGLFIPEQWGGLGLGAVEVAAIHEALAYGSLTSASVLFPSSLGTQLILRGGTDDQKADLLPAVAAGKLRISFALTETTSGSDAAALRTRATQSAGAATWRLNGTKVFITGADVADLLMVAARTNPDKRGGSGISVAIVPADSPGISITRIDTIGAKFQSSCEVVFDDVEVQEWLGGAGGIDNGWQPLRDSLDLERLTLAAQSVGLATRALEDAVAFVQDRESFGRKVSSYQAVRHDVADLATGIAAGRTMTRSAARRLAGGDDCSTDIAMAKLFTTEHCKRVCLHALQLFGGYGYTMDYPAQRYLRRSLVLTIGGGTSQIQRDIIARGLEM